MEHNTELKKLALAQLEYVITEDEKYLSEAANIKKKLYGSPNNFDHGSAENYITEMKLSQQKLSVQMQVSGIDNPEDMTVMRFYAAVDYLEQRGNEYGKKITRFK